MSKLRTFSRVDGDERGFADVRACIDSVITIFGHRLGEGITVEVEVGPPEMLECYPGLLNQALMNLVANSIDAVAGSGTITVTAGSAGDRYVIRVADSGPGIPAAVRHRIFEPFFTTKGVGSGTGLGLSITYAIVEKHQGTVSVDCPPGGGTIMTIDLPLATTRAT